MRFILRARILERTQMQRKTTSDGNEVTKISMLLVDETGSISSIVFGPKANEMNELEVIT